MSLNLKYNSRAPEREQEKPRLTGKTLALGAALIGAISFGVASQTRDATSTASAGADVNDTTAETASPSANGSLGYCDLVKDSKSGAWIIAPVGAPDNTHCVARGSDKKGFRVETK